MPYKVVSSAFSDVGLVRENNEDYWKQLTKEHFFVIADGMGGHQAGEIAAKEAVEHLCKIFQKSLVKSSRLSDLQFYLFQAIQEVNDIIFQMAFTHEKLKGMGTTLCCVYVHPDGLLYGHVGDSRIYRLRDNQIEQLTHDHSLLRELMDLGQINAQQAEDFLYKNIITRAIGTEPFVEPTVQVSNLQAGDILLMCTDGLSDLLSEEEMRHVLTRNPDKELAKELVKVAKKKGGYDNVTVLIVKIQDEDESKNLSRP
jgi:protein phosphatase